MLKKTFYTFLFLTFFSLSICNSNPFINENKLDDLDIKANKITFSTADELLKEKDLKMAGYGGGAPFGKIQLFTLSLTYEKPLTIREARKLLIYSVNKFVKNINDYKEIKPYLSNYPVTEKNIEVVIISHGLDGRTAPIPYIAFSSSKKGLLKYQTDTTPLTIVHEETFAEAEKIIKEASK